MVLIIGTLLNLLFYMYDYLNQYVKSSLMLQDFSYLFLSPREMIAILKMKYGGQIKDVRKIRLDQLAIELNDLDFCYATLCKVSRSFFVVIQQLPEQLKDVVCIFYLVLRGLDSVEDDMNYPNDQKILLLCNFHKNLLIDQWSINNVGDSEDYRILLSNFGKVINVFKSLDIKYQSVIINLTERMGKGMSEFVGKTNLIESIENYNLYCHYVAGLVGYGLSSLFSSSGLEGPHLDLHEDLSNSMGLFLQKTNIIRDYLEDLQSGRCWWPKQIWRNYSSHIDHFRDNPFNEESMECLNHMIMDSLNHACDVLNYLHQIKNRQIFEFCSIPQVMAIATLSELYNNPLAFTSSIKISKRLSWKLMINSSNLYQVHQWFYYFVQKIENKIPNKINSNNKQMHQIIQQIKHLCD